jgi:hypothetical protein
MIRKRFTYDGHENPFRDEVRSLFKIIILIIFDSSASYKVGHVQPREHCMGDWQEARGSA